MTGSLIAGIMSDEDTELRELDQRPRAGRRVSIRNGESTFIVALIKKGFGHRSAPVTPPTLAPLTSITVVTSRPY